ncbi:MAG: hypothetical protein RLZ98_1549 [Pseudomonadota bacterium]|jgi:predicted small lipoprotein YifL
MQSLLRNALIVLAAGLLLAGCGVRGNLDPPAEVKAEQQSAATADSGQGKPAGEAPKPHRTFLLDGLIQ